MIPLLHVPLLVLALGGARGVETRSVLSARAESAEKPVRTIAIEINGETLETDTPPLLVSGRVLVPLRDVFDALGIAVTREGNTITARLPTGSVDFQVGSAQASVNGRPVRLEAATIDRDGTTFAPLQLLVAAFGAQASYDPHTDRVEIVSAFIGRNSAAEQQRSDGGTDVQGVVSAIDSDSSPPALTVVRAGTSRTVSVTSDAKIWTEDVTIHSQIKGDFSDIRVGDAVHAILATDGRVVSVFDFYKSTSGTITAAAPAAIVLENGRVVTPSATTEISLNSGAARLADLHVGDFVTVRSNPESGELRTIVASRALAQESATSAPSPAGTTLVSISSVELSVQRPLRAGESFDVVMRGTPGGRATFDIGDYLAGLPMEEHTSGVYSGTYTIPDRFNVTQVPVYVELGVGGSLAPRGQATQTLSAATIPPAIGEVAPPSGEVVNNSRPSIFATYSAPTEIAINQSSVTLNVNGHDVTSSATRSSGFITYSPGVDIGDGPVTVIVRVSDAAGNTATKTWTFTIKTR
jgi:Copper amine oxidase N-terminal domain/Bacterial Ig-like domain/Domain of unknown function (DUF5666)